MNLGKISCGRNNNLDLVRFVAAIMVIFSHSFPIALGMKQLDPLAILTNDQISFGSLAVSIFFLYGGFLICKSMHRLQKGKAFFKARILRIFPPLIAVVVVSVFILGPILTNVSLKEYFSDSNTYKYLLNAVLVLQHNLPGVFEHNVYEGVVNGPLWTMPVEFLCYIMCFIFYKLHMLEKRYMKYTIVIFVVGCLCALALSTKIGILATMIRPMGLFFVGMIAFVYRDYIRISLKGCILSVFLIIVSLIAKVFPYTIFLLLPYLLLFIGYGTKIKFAQFAKHGEISYGVYLSAWPIQQIICEICGGRMNPVVNFLLATVFAVLMGSVICKIIEEPLAKMAKKKM